MDQVRKSQSAGSVAVEVEPSDITRQMMYLSRVIEETRQLPEVLRDRIGLVLNPELPPTKDELKGIHPVGTQLGTNILELARQLEQVNEEFKDIFIRIGL